MSLNEGRIVFNPSHHFWDGVFLPPEIPLGRSQVSIILGPEKGKVVTASEGGQVRASPGFLCPCGKEAELPTRPLWSQRPPTPNTNERSSRLPALPSSWPDLQRVWRVIGDRSPLRITSGPPRGCERGEEKAPEGTEETWPRKPAVASLLPLDRGSTGLAPGVGPSGLCCHLVARSHHRPSRGTSPEI